MESQKQDSDQDSPPRQQTQSPLKNLRPSFLQIEDVLKENQNIQLLINLLRCDLESDPGNRSVQEYHLIIDDIMKLLGGESDGRLHILYAIADIARGKIDKDLMDQKLLSLKSQNSIDFLAFFTGLASLSSVIQQLPQNEQRILSQKIQTTILSPPAEAIFKILRITSSQVMLQLLKLIFTPALVDVHNMIYDFQLKKLFQRNGYIQNFIRIMLKPLINRNDDPNKSIPLGYYRHSIRNHNIGQDLMSRNHHSILQLALNLHSGNIEALNKYENLNMHLPNASRDKTQQISIVQRLLTLLNPRCIVPLYDNFRALMLELGNQKGSNAIKLANLDLNLLGQIEQSSGILKQALASVLIAIEQFPVNLKSGWFERAVLKRLRGQDSYKLRTKYQAEEYLKQADILQGISVKGRQQEDEDEDEDEEGEDEEGEDEEGEEEKQKARNKIQFDFISTDFDFYQTAVFNKYAKYGYHAKVDILKHQFGYDDAQIRQILGDDQKSYQQHFVNLWVKDLEPEELFISQQQAYVSKTKQKQVKQKAIGEILKDKKVDLITKKRLNSMSEEILSDGNNDQQENRNQDQNLYVQNAGMLKKRWTIQEDRDQVQNIWQGLIVALTKVGHVQIADIIFAWNILALRQIAKNPDKVKKDQNAYHRMLSRIDDILHYIELHGLANKVFDQNFNKFGIVKLIAMTLGVKIPALAEKWLLEGVSRQYKQNIEAQKLDDLESSQQPQNNYQDQNKLIQKSIQEQRINYTWDEIEDFYVNQDDNKDLRNLYVKCFPYNQSYEKNFIPDDDDQQANSFTDKDLEQQRWKKNCKREGDLKYWLPKIVHKQQNLQESQYYQLKTYYIALQQVTFIDSEYYEFLMELSEGHVEVWQRNKQILKDNNLLSEQEYKVVQALTQLINIRKIFKTQLKSRFEKMLEEEEQDWQVPNDEDHHPSQDGEDQQQQNKLSQSQQEQIKNSERHAARYQSPKKYKLNFIKQIMEQLFSNYNQKMDFDAVSELIAFTLGTPNTDDYQTIYEKADMKSSISGLMHTSSFAHARVIIPGLPVYWTENQIITHEEEINYVKNYIQQLAEFSKNISQDQQLPFDPHVVAGLAFLSYNKKLAFQLLFTDAFRGGREDDVLQQQAINSQTNTRPLAQGRIYLDRFLKQAKFRRNNDNNPTLLAAAAQRVLDSNLSFDVNQRSNQFDDSQFISNHFSKEFIFQLPSMFKSLDQEQNDKLLIISHILIGLISGVAQNCYEDAVTALNFLQRKVDNDLYTYIEHLIYQKFDIQIIKQQIKQLEGLQGSHLYGSSIENQRSIRRNNNRRNLGRMQPQSEQSMPNNFHLEQMKGEDQLAESLDQDSYTNKAAAQKHPGIKRPKKPKQGVKDDGGDQEKVQDQKEESQPSLDSEAQIDMTHRQSQNALQELKSFRCQQVIKRSSDGYKLNLLGKVKGENAILKLIRTPLAIDQLLEFVEQQNQGPQEEEKNKNPHLFSQDGDEQDVEDNDQDKSSSDNSTHFKFESLAKLKFKKASCYFINAQFKRFKLIPDVQSSPKTIDCELILPADHTLIMKYKERKTIVIDQSKRIYLTKTLRILQEEPKEKLQWIRNIFSGYHKDEKIILDKKDEQDGYILFEDYDYELSMPDLKFHALAIPTNPRLRNIKAIQDSYNIMSYELVIYVHYPPTFQWLHIHFSHVENQSQTTSIGKAIMLRDIIQNIELKSNYYEDATLAIKMKKGDKLLEELRKENAAKNKQ